jgi:hypothetical protein
VAKKNKKIKLPKKMLGLKVPKQPRKAVNAVLKQVPASQSQPTLAVAIGLLATALAKQLEGPIREFLDRQDGHKDAPRKTPEQPPSAVPH